MSKPTANRPANAKASAPRRAAKAPSSPAESMDSHSDSATHFQALASSVPMLLLDGQGRITKVNEPLAALLQYSEDELLGQSHSAIVAKLLRGTPAQEAFWNALTDGEAQHGEYRWATKRSQDVWVQASYTPIVSASGRPVQFLVVAFDVTAQYRERAESKAEIEAVRKSQAIIEYNMDGSIITANQNFLFTLGYELNELQGKHHSMLVEEALAQGEEYWDFWQRLNRGEFDTGEYKRIGRGGQEIWLQASYNPIFDTDGHPFKVVEVATDVTAQVEAHDKSRGAVHFDMNGRILYANENFLKIVGYTFDEVKGQPHRMFLDPDDESYASYDEIWNGLRRGEPIDGEFKRISKDGRTIWLESAYNPLFDINGKPYKVIKYATDITDRIRLNDEINRVLNETIRVATALGEGDLTQTMLGDFAGRFEELQTVINKFMDSMGSTLLQTKEAASAVGEATVQLRKSSEHLARGSSEQQHACQVASEALVETSTMVAATANNASRANELVRQAATAADEGQDKMSVLTQAMDDIASSSSEISKIIKVIDEIAFQTNLLAVNAAVEAARAGRHGRGFAVVAQEVRSLAGRSAKAAQATAELIQKSSVTVTRGVENVDETATALVAIRDNVIQARNIVGEIYEASAEQSRGLNEVRHSMDEVNESATSASQQAAQLAAAATSLTDQSDMLRMAVSKFTLKKPPVAANIDDEVLGQIAALLGVDSDRLASIVGEASSSSAPDAGRSAEATTPPAVASETQDSRGYGVF